MEAFLKHAQFYRNYHQTKANFYMHLVGVPLLILSLMIFFGFFHLSSPHLFDVTLAEIGTSLILIYYIWLNWRLGLLLVPIFIILLWISNLISYRGMTSFSVWFFIIVFIAAWVFQLTGHYLEGKRPAFLTNLQQALVAPLFLLAELFFMFGYMPKLKEAIYGRDTVQIAPETPPPTPDA